MLTLDAGWEVAGCEPGAHLDPAGIDGLDWIAARVPGTVAAALAAAGRDDPDADLDARDWWFRTRFARPAVERPELVLDGVATVAEVFLNGERVVQSDSMFAAHRVAATGLRAADNELAIRCVALAPLLAAPRRPRARWRSRLAADGNLRWWRTTLLGRAPGFAPGPAPVGPWRPVRIEDASAPRPVVRARLDGEDGVVEVSTGAEPGATASVAVGGREAALRDGRATVRVPAAERWWPHTAGAPRCHEVVLLVAGEPVARRRVGFRTLAPGPVAAHDVPRDGLALHVNGAPVFCRGAVWTPLDPVGLAPSEAQLRAALEQVAGAGMNMLRVAGWGVYESSAFFDLCDELGILVWQDLMFANLDYPVDDPGFRAGVEAELEQVLEGLAGRPSFAVLCGNSEIEQQVAMLGLDPVLGRGELFGELAPAALARSGADAVYVPSAPCGGVLPFRPGAGVANYYGVGGYRRGLDDARRAGVRFAAECLAFANVGDGEDVGAHVPRDAGADWDFADVRDHYLALLFGVDPAVLRGEDPERYAELSRAVTGEVMAEVLGEWRRADSPCGGALVLWLRDVVPGAGWGIVDRAGRPKLALGHVRRALAPVAVWTTDEGLNGLAVHVANDGAQPLAAELRLALYRGGELLVGEASERLELPARGAATRDAEALLGRFADVSWAYRFGPPAQDAVVVTLTGEGGELLSQALRFPAGRPTERIGADRLGLRASARPEAGGDLRVTVTSERLAYGVRVLADGATASDDGFCVEPGGARELRLRALPGAGPPGPAVLSALNLDGELAVELGA